jgi:hypothetical protein
MYNRATLVGETLDSVLAQTYADWECIVVDDGSTDNSVEVVQKYVDKDSRFKLLIRPKDRIKGGPTCRNIGYENSTGEIVYWFDSDDLLSPEFFEIVVETFIQKPEAEYLYAEIDSFHGTYKKQNSQKHNKPPYQGTPFEQLCSIKAKSSTQRLIWKRKLIEQCNIKWTEGLVKAQDSDFVYQVLATTDNQGDWICGQPMIHCRRHRGQMTSTSMLQKEKTAVVTTEVLINSFHVLCEKRKISDQLQKLFLRGFVRAYVLTGAIIVGSSNASQLAYQFLCTQKNAGRMLRACTWSIWKMTPILHFIGKGLFKFRHTFIVQQLKRLLW